jgi:hypothetical protein
MVHARRISPHISRSVVVGPVGRRIRRQHARTAAGQTLLEYSAEARFQLDFHVPDAALNAMLPPGFTLNVATQGRQRTRTSA